MWIRVVALALLGATLGAPTGALGGPGTLPTLLVDTNPLRMTAAPIHIAIEEGYFAREGVQVSFLTLRGGASQGIPALLTGRTDVYPASLGAAPLGAIQQGARLRIVADYGHVDAGDRSGGIVLMVRQDLIDSGRFRTLRDLRGMRIGLATRGGVGELFFRRILRDRAFLTEADVRLQDIPSQFQVDAFRAKALDASTVNEPFTTRLAILGLATAVVTLPDIIPRTQTETIIFGPNLLVRNPGLGQRFMNGYLRAIQQYNQGKTDRNIAILAKRLGEEEEVLRRMTWQKLRADGRVNVESIMQMQAWWVREGWLDRVVRVEEFLDMRFADQAFRQLTQSR